MERMNGILGVIVSSIAVIVVVLVGWFVFVSPQRSKADRLSAQVDSARSELTADEALLGAKTRKETRLASQNANRAMPDQAEVSNILRELDGFAKQSRTEIDNITPGTQVPVGNAIAIPISLTFKGRYFGLQQLLKLLRTSADVTKDKADGKNKLVATGRLYTVDSIQFNGGQATAPGQATTNDIQAQIALNAFMYGGTATAVAPPATETTTAAAPTG